MDKADNADTKGETSQIFVELHRQFGDLIVGVCLTARREIVVLLTRPPNPNEENQIRITAVRPINIQIAGPMGPHSIEVI